MADDTLTVTACGYAIELTVNQWVEDEGLERPEWIAREVGAAAWMKYNVEDGLDSYVSEDASTHEHIERAIRLAVVAEYERADAEHRRALADVSRRYGPMWRWHAERSMVLYVERLCGWRDALDHILAPEAVRAADQMATREVGEMACAAE